MSGNELTKEVIDIAISLAESYRNIAVYEALQIAVRIQHNRVLSDAFMLGMSCPSALEAIAMELGANKQGSTIKDAIYNLKAD